MQGLPFSTPTQFAALFLVLIAGWLFGLASTSGGRKWRERYQDEEQAHAGYRREAEVKLREADARIRELEAENARLGGAVATGAPVAAAVAGDAPAEAGAGWRGWFGWGRDNLARIRGIDAAREARLNELGIKTYRELEGMTAEDEAALEQRLGLKPGEIAREQWREQAALLRTGSEEEHTTRFG